MTTTLVSHITTKISTQSSEMKKQGLTHRSYASLSSLVFRPTVEKEEPGQIQNIDISHF